MGYLPYQLVQDFFHQQYFHPKSVGIALEAELGGDSEDALSPAAVGVARTAGWKWDWKGEKSWKFFFSRDFFL